MRGFFYLRTKFSMYDLESKKWWEITFDKKNEFYAKSYLYVFLTFFYFQLCGSQ